MSQPVTSAYTTQVRLLLCGNCGAPHDAPPNGGVIACKFCGAQSQLAPRAQLPAFAPMTRTQLSEPERLLRLRMQDNRPLLPPQGIAHLFGPGGEIPPWKEQEVFAAWQSCRKRAATGALDAAEELFFLTEALGNKFVQASDWTRHRAMLESALEALSLPRHRSSVAATLCLGACRQDDLQGAETWLQIVDSASDDLYADSMYRMARARVATKKGDFPTVLQMLGQTSGEIPIHDAIDALAAVYRANAWERTGRIDLAVQSLATEMAKSPQHRASIGAIVRIHGVCQTSFAQAETQAGARSADAAAALTSAGIEKVFVPLGAVFVVIGILWFLGAAASGVITAATTGNVGAAFGGIGAGFGGIIFGVVGGIFFLIGRTMAQAAKKAAYLAQHGVRAQATVISVQGTGTKINGVAQLELRLRVELTGRPPYETSLRALLGSRGVAPGSVVAVRVDPNDPNTVALEA